MAGTAKRRVQGKHKAVRDPRALRVLGAMVQTLSAGSAAQDPRTTYGLVPGAHADHPSLGA